MLEEFNKMVAAGKLRKEHVPLLVKLTQAGYVKHRSWGGGRIRSIDTVWNRLLVDFSEKLGHAIQLGFATQILKPSTADAEAEATTLQIEQLRWKLLPPGQAGLLAIQKYVRSCGSRARRVSAFDPTRFEFFLGLSPSQVYAGQNEFGGYLAFLFNGFPGAILENPVEGNAIYVFDANWRELSRCTKSELFCAGHLGVRRIVHSGDWKQRVRRIIRR